MKLNQTREHQCASDAAMPDDFTERVARLERSLGIPRQVPDLVGLKLGDVQACLPGTVLCIVGPAEGRVIRQRPAAGSENSPTLSVTVFLASESAPPVPPHTPELPVRRGIREDQDDDDDNNDEV